MTSILTLKRKHENKNILKWLLFLRNEENIYVLKFPKNQCQSLALSKEEFLHEELRYSPTPISEQQKNTLESTGTN